MWGCGVQGSGRVGGTFGISQQRDVGFRVSGWDLEKALHPLFGGLGSLICHLSQKGAPFCIPRLLLGLVGCRIWGGGGGGVRLTRLTNGRELRGFGLGAGP